MRNVPRPSRESDDGVCADRGGLRALFAESALRGQSGKGGDFHSIHIEGKPISLRCKIDLMASVEKGLSYQEGDHTTPAYYATVVPMVQAVPVVCAANPGIVYPETFAHYSTDYRKVVQK
jgi:hypothetical protein